MSARPKSVRARAAVIIGALAFVAAGAIAVNPASAASEDVFFGLQSGTLQVGDQTFVLPSEGGFNGTLDDETGALSGTFAFPEIRADVTDPFPVVVFASLDQQGPATGSIDPTTGAATLDLVLRIGLRVETGTGVLLVGGSCGVGPIDLTFTGTYVSETGTLTLNDEGFALPNSSGCAGAIDFGPVIDELLGGGTSATLVLSSSDGPITPPSTSPTSPTTGGTQPGGPTPTVSAPPTPTVPTPSGPNPPRTAREGQQQVRLTILDQVADEAPAEETVPQVTG